MEANQNIKKHFKILSIVLFIIFIVFAVIVASVFLKFNFFRNLFFS
jgi:hypothetical protein